MKQQRQLRHTVGPAGPRALQAVCLSVAGEWLIIEPEASLPKQRLAKTRKY